MNEPVLSIEQWNPAKHRRSAKPPRPSPRGDMAEAVILQAMGTEQVVTIPVGVSSAGLTVEIYSRARAKGMRAHISWLSEFSFAVIVEKAPKRKRTA